MKVLSTALNPKQSSLFHELTSGIEIDQIFLVEEFASQLAWARELYLSDYLNTAEWDEISEILYKLKHIMSNEDYLWSVDDEDIHMTIEKEVTKINSNLGKKMHLGRSRNDLISTSLKLYTSRYCASLTQEISKLIEVLLFLADKDLDCVVPSFTHSQSALPIRMSHIWNFHSINFLTGIDKVQNLKSSCMEIMPLGSSSIAGTHLNINLDRMAKELGFLIPTANSIHGVSDRDFMVDLSYYISRISLHIVRLCEDIIHYSTTHLGIIILPSKWSSGSSAMPNKRNPDFFEIIRAKAKTLICNSGNSLNISSSFGSGYFSDFHELKKLVLKDGNNLMQILNCLIAACKDLEVSQKNSEISLNRGHILATDIANQYVKEGMIFRDAYNKVAESVSLNERIDKQISFKDLDIFSSVESKNASGGTSKKQVQNTIDWISERLQINRC